MNSRAAQRAQRIVTEPIRPLLLRLTGSALMGNVALHTLGIVDTFFISRLGTVQLAAASFVIPVHMIYVSLALGIGMGMSSLNSRLIGESRFKDSRQLVRDGLIFAALFSVVMAVLGAVAMDHIFRVMGAEPDTIPYIRRYLGVLLLGLPPLMLVTIGNSTFRSMGNIKMSALLAACMALLNMIFDPLLIFGIGPFPRMGIEGAAWATMIAALLTLLLSLYVLGAVENVLEFSRPALATLRRHWHQILGIGLPAMGANLMTPLAAAIMTGIVSRYGDEMVAGFGVGSRIEMLSLLVVMALSATLPMFIGQNMGAGKTERAGCALRDCLRFVLVFQVGIYALLLVLNGPVAASFSDNPRVIEIIRLYLMILPLTYGAHGVVILVMVSLNVLRRPRMALLLTITRLLLLYLPLAWLFSRFFGIRGLFIGAACGNLVAGLVAYMMVRKICLEQDVPFGALIPVPGQTRD